MLVHLKKLSAQIVIYGLGDVVTSVVVLVLLPVYTHLLSPEDYGRLAIVIVVSSICSILLDSGQRSAFFRFYRQNDDDKTHERFTGTVFIYLLVSGAAILSPVVLFFNLIAAPLIQDEILRSLIQVALIGTFFDIGTVIPLATFRVQQRAARYAVLSVVRFFISASLNILAVVVFHWGVVGVVYANLVTSLLFFLVCMGFTLRTLKWTVDFRVLRQVLSFGLPLVPANLAAWGLTFSDRFFLKKYGDFSQVGIYAVGYSVAGVLNMVMNWFNIAWGPYCFSIATHADAKRVYARVMTYVLCFCTLVGLGVSLFGHEVISLLTAPSYEGAARVVPLIVLAYLFFEMNYLIAFGLDLSYKTAYYPLIVISGAMINLALNFMLIPSLGMMGAAISTALSYAWLPIVGYGLIRRLYPVPYEWGRLLKLAIVSTGIYLTSTVLKTGRPAIDLPMSAMLILVWGLALYGWKFFTHGELAIAGTTLRRSLPILQGYLKQALLRVFGEKANDAEI